MKVDAKADAPESSLAAFVNEGPVQESDIFSLEWGLLIGIVMLALVVIARSSKRPG